MVEFDIERQQVIDRVLVDAPRRVVGQVVRQVRADDDQRLLAAPQPVEHFGHLCGSGVADRQRQQRELAKQPLQERQLHFERMLRRVRQRAIDDLRQVAQRGNRRRNQAGHHREG